METISTLRDLYESYERIRVSIERVSENKETAASVLYRIQGSVSQLRALEKHCPPVKRDDNLKYLRTALRDIQKEFSAVERLITKLEIPEGFTFKAWYRGSDIKKHLEEAEKQIDKALHHFTFLSNVRQEYNQHEILSQVRKTADTTTRDRYSSHTTSHLRDKHSEQLLRKNHSSPMTNHQTLALQAPIINLTFNLSSENLAAGQEKPSRDSRSKEVLQVEEKSRSRVNQPNMRLNANIGISQPLNDVLRHLDAQRYSSTSISTRDSTSSLEDYPLTRRRKLLDPTTARARNDSDLARISKLIREDPLPVRTLANRMIALSTRLVDIGNTEMACEFGRRTVSVLRKTRGYKVDRFYGNALQHCSFFYSSAGNHSEALRFAQDAVTIFSDISRLKPRQEKAGVNLGMALNTLGYALSSVGLIDEAVDACRRSVELLRTLHYQSRSVYKADLALCMVNYSNCMLDSRQFSEAVRVTSEAGYIYERCYSVEPSTYGWEYGVCLSTQAKCLIAHGHVQDALPAIKESIRVFREFDSRSPGQLNGELASALLNCFEVYFELHRETEARTIVLETLGLFRRLATKNPSMFRLKLADTLKCSARLNFRESCYEQADRDLQEALSIFKNDSRRYVDKINLARSLQLAAICRRRLGDYHNAKDCAQQAVDVRRELAGRNHSNALYHKIQLAEAQLELCRCRANLHLNDKVSLKILTDVKEIYHCIAGAQKFWLAKDMHKMALGLHSLSKLQIAAKQHSEALNSVQDAVKYLEAATAQRSDVYVESDFVKLYITQSTLYSQFGHHNQAMDSARRAVEMANILWDTDAQNRLLELAKKRFMACNTTMEQYFLQSMSHLVSAGQTKVHFQDALVA